MFGVLVILLSCHHDWDVTLVVYRKAKQKGVCTCDLQISSSAAGVFNIWTGLTFAHLTATVAHEDCHRSERDGRRRRVASCSSRSPGRCTGLIIRVLSACLLALPLRVLCLGSPHSIPISQNCNNLFRGVYGQECTKRLLLYTKARARVGALDVLNSVELLVTVRGEVICFAGYLIGLPGIVPSSS